MLRTTNIFPWREILNLSDEEFCLKVEIDLNVY